jgi:hypothetical protein
MLTLDQAQVDTLAAFTEACTELGNEPFFKLSEPLPNFQASSDWKRVTYQMGDRGLFRAGLVPFRRVWAPAEPAHWATAAGILIGAGLPLQENFSAKSEAGMIRHEIDGHELTKQIPLTKGRIIELWLGAIVAHHSWDGRKEWEAALAQHGHAALDFAFRSAVKTLGYHFQRLADYAARPALALAATDLKLTPSFAVGAATATKRREVTPDGTVILREGSAEHGPDETFEERYRRLVQAYDNQSLGRILTRLEASQGEVMRAVLWCGTFAELLESVEGRLEITTLPWEQAGKNRSEVSRGSSASADGIWFYSYEGNLIVTGAKMVPLLDAGILRLRQQLLAKL